MLVSESLYSYIILSLLNTCCTCAWSEPLTVERCIHALLVVHITGCFALQCGRCKTHFCAWCLTDCTTSRAAHAHVKLCKASTASGALYCTLKQFDKAQNKRRHSAIAKYMTTLPAAVQTALTVRLRLHLTDSRLQL
jgi:hypothetical protein